MRPTCASASSGTDANTRSRPPAANPASTGVRFCNANTACGTPRRDAPRACHTDGSRACSQRSVPESVRGTLSAFYMADGGRLHPLDRADAAADYHLQEVSDLSDDQG